MSRTPRAASERIADDLSPKFTVVEEGPLSDEAIEALARLLVDVAEAETAKED